MNDRVKELALALVDAVPKRFQPVYDFDGILYGVKDLANGLLVAFAVDDAASKWAHSPGWLQSYIGADRARWLLVVNGLFPTPETPPPAATSRAVKEGER